MIFDPKQSIMKKGLFLFFLLLTLNSFSQRNWGAGFGMSSYSSGGGLGNVSFEFLKYETHTRFEKKVERLSSDGNSKQCNLYMDKNVRKGKLTSNELSLVYYTKCRLYSNHNYDYWGFRNERGYHEDDYIYPYSDSFPINHADTLMRYSKLFLSITDTSFSLYEPWLVYVYNDLCKTINYGLDTLIEKAVKSKEYYENYRTECDAYFERIEFLRHAVKDYHPLNCFAIDLMEFRYKQSLGLANTLDKEYIKQQFADCMLQYRDWNYERGKVLWIRLRSNQYSLYGYDRIESEIQKLLNQLNNSDFDLAHHLLRECPIYLTNQFAEDNGYDTTWSIVKTGAISKNRLIDLRDSTDFQTNKFNIFTTIEIAHDIPNGDTIIIDGVHVNHHVRNAKLVHPIKISGKGSASLTIKTWHPILDDDRVYTIWFSSNDLQVISNRGKRNVKFKVNVIGQTSE